MGDLDRYLVLLRRELTRAQARLSRAERQRDRLLEANAALRRRLTEQAATKRRIGAKRRGKPAAK